MTSFLIQLVQDALKNKSKWLLLMALLLGSVELVLAQTRLKCPNLVINGDFTLGNSGFTSLPSSCNPAVCQEGTSCIGINFLNKCNRWPNSVDHTSGTGNFLSIDGVNTGIGPFEIWRQSTPITVSPNTNYKFCFWVKSVYSFAQQQQLNLQMGIENATTGTILQSQLNPINQTPPQWTEYCMLWNSGSNTSIRLVIKQMTPGLFQDFGIDDIRFCCFDCEDFENSFSNSTFNYTATPPSSLYTFTPPSGTVSGDVFSWDFGDGNTSTASSPQNTYQSAGTYLVSLCIQRPQPNGDTCKVKLCQQIVVQTCRQCVQYINANPVDLAVDMSAWSSGSGPVTFYPTTSFAPFNVRITWDFNCDGTPDQVSSGNSPVTFNFPCGPKTICYTVECLQSQQVSCSTKSFRKTFNIPCPQNQSECPNLVINGDFTAGDDGSFSSPSLAPNCTGACGTGAYCVGDNFKDKCNLWPNSVDHTTGSGNFMSIDGISGGTGSFEVWRQNTSITVQPNTTYRFKFWVKSVYTFAQQPQLFLGSFIEDANGLSIKSIQHHIRQTSPMWTEYSMVWNSGSNTSVKLVIKQTNSGAFRDFGIDDISFCCVDCADFMTDAMDFGIQGTGVSGNTYKFCLSSNISANDIVKWDLDCNGTIDATTHCATFTLTPSNTQICATVYHVIKPGDTCRVKLNTCLPDVVNTDSCTCQSPIFENDVKAGFSWVKNPPYTVTFTPYGLLDKCDKVQWSFGNASAQATSVGNASVSYTYPSTPGSYSVCMFVTRTEPNGTICKREFCLLIKLDGTVGLTEVGLSKLTVNPNPTHNSVSISVPNALFNRKHLLRLTTIDGKVVKSMAIESAEMKMDMEMLPAGLYFLYLSDDKGNVLVRPTKVVKQ